MTIISLCVEINHTKTSTKTQPLPQLITIKTKKNTMKKIPALVYLIIFVAISVSQAQTKYETKSFTVIIKGTSTMHDWESNVNQVSLSGDFAVDASENLEKTQHWAEAQANVQITITHISKTMPLQVKVCKIAPNKYNFVSQADILMTDFGITPPTAGLGLIKVRNKITIHLDFIAQVEQ
jgi:hypothetical protein